MQINSLYIWLIIVFFADIWVLVVPNPSKQYEKVKLAHTSGGLMKGLQSLGEHWDYQMCGFNQSDITD